MTHPDVEARHAAYRAGLCIDCRNAWHSAGRPRCDGCHQKLLDQRAQGQ